MSAHAALVSQVIFGWNPAWTAAAILVASYALIVSERMNIAVIALAGASATVLLGVLDQEEALRGIDFNTIALLVGMMILVTLTARSGIFQYLAIRATRAARARPAGILILLQIVTAVISALLDNVTTVLLIAPVTLVICEQLEVDAFPYLVAEVFASNIGGTATLIGDPPNILIGSSAGLSFNDFLFNVAPGILLVQGATIFAFHMLYGRHLRTTPAAVRRVLRFKEREAITDTRLLVKSLVVLAAVVVGFMMARSLGLEVGTISIAGASALLVLHLVGQPPEKHGREVQETFNSVDWTTIFFFVGLFVIVHGVEVTGLLTMAAQGLMSATGGNRYALVVAVLCGSALISSVVNNIPFVAAMIPMIKAIGLAPGSPFGSGPEQLMPLWWALAFGACLGGNGTLIGASANLMVAGLAQRAGKPIGFVAFTKIGFPLMAGGVLIALAYMLLRYM